MPFEEWPLADRAAWEAAISPGADFLDEPGAAAHLALSTRQGLVRTWGQFLAFLDQRDELDRSASVAVRATPTRVGAWLAELNQRVRATVVRRMLVGLSLALGKMVPDQDWSWISRHPARPLPAAVRASRKPIRTFDPVRLEAELRQQMDAHSDGPRTPAQALTMRNLMLVRLAIYTGLRRRNLAELRLGQHLRDDGERYMICLEATETKTSRPLSFPLADAITPDLRAYIRDWRPLLVGDRVDAGHLWLTVKGQAICDATVARIMQSVTRRLIGEAFNPHSVRHTMATVLLREDPLALRTAAAALGHVNSRSVNEVYDLSGAEGAHRLWQRMLKQRMRRSRGR